MVRRAVERKISTSFQGHSKILIAFFQRSKLLTILILQEPPAMNREDNVVQLTNIIQITQLGIP